MDTPDEIAACRFHSCCHVTRDQLTATLETAMKLGADAVTSIGKDNSWLIWGGFNDPKPGKQWAQYCVDHE